MPRPSSILPVLLAAVLALGVLARPAAAYTAAQVKAPATVTLVRSDYADCGAGCPEWIALTGRIDAGTPALLNGVLARLGRRDVPVLVDSPGGSVQAAMAIGRTIRARRMAVAVAGTMLTDCAASDRACAARRGAGVRPGLLGGSGAACASACVLVLAAGVERSVGPFTPVGVHQMTARKTFTRVMNHFRILSRMVNGRRVEISRTLIGTEPISSRTVVVAAPKASYSEVDRYLLGLGIAESIMPLMRSAPPSGIHWMTPDEIAATRIATDSLDARTLVARAAAAEPAVPAKPNAAAKPSLAPVPTIPPESGTMALATAALGDGRRGAGIVDWRVTGTPDQPTLAGAADVPGLGLHGTLTIRRDTAPGALGGFLATVDLGRPAAIEAGRVWTTEAPRVCDATTCNLPFTPVAETDDGQGRRAFRVRAVWGDGFLSNLRDRDRILIPLSADDGKKGWVSLSIDRDARQVLDRWEERCCGVSASPTAVAGISRATLVTASSPGPGASPDDGTVVWRFDPGIPPDRPAPLQATIETPRLAATASVKSDAGALVIALRVTRDPAGPVVRFTAGPPGFRDTRDGVDQPLRASLSQAGDTATMTVAAADRTAAIEGFRDRPWLAVPIRLAGRDPVALLLNLNGAGRPAIEAWLAREGRDAAQTRAACCDTVPPPSRGAASAAADRPTGAASAGTVAYALRAAGSDGWPIKGAATLSWMAVPDPSGPTGAEAARSGAIFVGAADLHLILVAGPAPGGDVEIDLNLTPDASRFGPPTGLVARVAGERDSSVAVMPGLDPTHYGGAFRLRLAKPAGRSEGATLDLDLSDGDGRHLALAIPIEGPLATLLDRSGPMAVGAGAASPPADASWTLLHEGTLPPRPGAPSLLGSIEVPDAGLRLSVQGGLAPPGGMGGVALTVQTVPDIARFGPVTEMAVQPVEAVDGRTALIGAAYRRVGGYDVTLAPAAPLPPDARLVFALTDARGRRLDVAVPLPDALRDLLAAAARPSS